MRFRTLHDGELTATELSGKRRLLAKLRAGSLFHASTMLPMRPLDALLVRGDGTRRTPAGPGAPFAPTPAALLLAAKANAAASAASSALPSSSSSSSAAAAAAAADTSSVIPGTDRRSDKLARRKQAQTQQQQQQQTQPPPVSSSSSPTSSSSASSHLDAPHLLIAARRALPAHRPQEVADDEWWMVTERARLIDDYADFTWAERALMKAWCAWIARRPIVADAAVPAACFEVPGFAVFVRTHVLDCSCGFSRLRDNTVHLQSMQSFSL